MTQINMLSAVDSVQSGDLLPLFAINNGDARKAAMSVLLAYMQTHLDFPDPTQPGVYTTQYSAPSTTGFNVVITDGVLDATDVHLILTPLAGYTTGTITLPPVASLKDKQLVLVNCTEQVVTLVIEGNGVSAVRGGPTSLAADSFFELKYDVTLKTWYRVG